MRASFVFAVGALDAYIHHRILARVAPFIKECVRANKKEKLGDLVKFIDEKIKLKTTDFIVISEQSRPLAHLKTKLEKKLYEIAFQNPGTIEQNIQLIGIDDIWRYVALRLRVPESDLRRELASYAIRRNQIVHEGDRQRSKMKKNLRRGISKGFVTSTIDNMESIVRAIETHSGWSHI